MKPRFAAVLLATMTVSLALGQTSGTQEKVQDNGTDSPPLQK